MEVGLQNHKISCCTEQNAKPIDLVLWEAYGTWISGFLLLVIAAYLSADLYMINMEKFDITQTDAILISIFGIILGWIIYDQICRYVGKQKFKHSSYFHIISIYFFS